LKKRSIVDITWKRSGPQIETTGLCEMPVKKDKLCVGVSGKFAEAPGKYRHGTFDSLGQDSAILS